MRLLLCLISCGGVACAAGAGTICVCGVGFVAAAAGAAVFVCGVGFVAAAAGAAGGSPPRGVGGCVAFCFLLGGCLLVREAVCFPFGTGAPRFTAARDCAPTPAAVGAARSADARARASANAFEA